MPRNVKLINDGTINKNRVQIGELRIYFSYETPIAFYSPLTGNKCRVNDWQTTTGRYLNEIEPDKTKRIEGNLFEGMLEQALASLFKK